MELAQRGDRDAYRSLLEDVTPLVRRFLRRRLGDGDSVEDVVQETLLAVHRARHTYDPGRAIEPWLFAIARNAAVDHLRRRLVRTSWEQLTGDLPDTPVASDAGAPRLERLLEQLPPRQREAFELVQLNGLSVEAAAARVGITTGALKVRAHRAYKTLRAMLGR
jgi:RNA polymerase sigma-70 factor, ECF subfamily